MTIVDTERFRSIAESHLALCASGTATLEVGLIGTPMIVVYKVGFATFLLGRLLLRIPHISLANLVLGEAVVPELIQGNATPDTIASQSRAMVSDRGRIDQMRAKLASLRSRLGKGGASQRAARHVGDALRAIESET